LLGKQTYWQTASGRRAAARPDIDVATLDVRPDEDEGCLAAIRATRTGQLTREPRSR
jgi:hypothetical protein